MRRAFLKRPARWACAMLAAFALACGSEQRPPPANRPATHANAPSAAAPSPSPVALSPAGPGDATAGALSYATFCASCHGKGGCGDGPLAETLDPKPARHCDGDVMNAMEDSYLVEVITRGGPAMGKSPLMAAWGGTLSPQQIQDVVVFIRSLADPPYDPPHS